MSMKPLIQKEFRTICPSENHSNSVYSNPTGGKMNMGKNTENIYRQQAKQFHKGVSRILSDFGGDSKEAIFVNQAMKPRGAVAVLQGGQV